MNTFARLTLGTAIIGLVAYLLIIIASFFGCCLDMNQEIFMYIVIGIGAGAYALLVLTFWKCLKK